MSESDVSGLVEEIQELKTGIQELKSLVQSSQSGQGLQMGFQPSSRDRDTVYIAANKGYLWYRTDDKNYDVHFPIEEDSVVGRLTDIEFYPKKYKGKVSPKVSICINAPNPIWLRTGADTVTFRTFMLGVLPMANEEILKPVRLVIRRSDKNDTVVFLDVKDPYTNRGHRTDDSSKFDQIYWLPIETKVFELIKTAGGKPWRTKKELDAALPELVRACNLSMEDASDHLRAFWERLNAEGKPDRSLLNLGEYTEWVRRLEYLRDHPEKTQ